MTDARAAWLRDEDRRRSLRALGYVLAAYALALVLALILGLGRTEELGAYSGPVMVRLGRPEGEDVRRSPDLPEPPLRQAETLPTPPSPPVPTPSPAPATPPAAAAPARPAPTAQPAPSAPAAPAAQAAAPPRPVVLRGSEAGNTYELAFAAGAGVADRNFGPPIWLYMPLPFELSEELLKSVPDFSGANMAGTAAQRRAAFERVYERGPRGSWILRGGVQPGFDARPDLWAALEDAGYPIARAEYKQENVLRPVEILFRVSPYDAAGGVRLEDILIERSSGISHIDEAVRYGFSKGSFSNSGTVPVSGRFTYRF